MPSLPIAGERDGLLPRRGAAHEEARLLELSFHHVQEREVVLEDARRIGLLGPDPEGRSYYTWASFSDPDGNTWALQQLPARG